MRQLIRHLLIFTIFAIAAGTTSPKNEPRFAPSKLLIGCYRDTAVHDFELEMTQVPPGNMSECFKACQKYRFAAIQKRSKCWCGNEFGRFGENPIGCTTPCDDGEACGGQWANSAYLLNPLKSYRGCLQSGGASDNQVLAANLPTETLTVAKCLEMCMGYAYLGIEKGKRCWCIKAINHYFVLPSAKCDSFCPDSSQCGGRRALSVYDSLKISDRSHQLSVATLKNCYQNPRTSKYFTEMRRYSKNVTISQCQMACFHFNYLGVEEGQRCWCDNFVDNDNVVDSALCTDKCLDGNSCGGKWILSVYTLTKLIYVACIKGGPGLKTFQKRDVPKNDFSLAECFKQCTNYSFLAVKDASECWCGNVKDLNHFTQGECTMICQGDGNPCGGLDSYSLYGFKRPIQEASKTKLTMRVGEDAYYMMKVKEENQLRSGIIDMADGNEYVVLVPKQNADFGESAEELSPFGHRNEAKNMDAKEFNVRKAIDDSGLAKAI